MADLARIKSNVAKMISMNAPESDIDGYIASEGVTVDDVRDFGKDYTTGRLYTIDRGLSFGTGRKLQGLYDAAMGKIGDLGEAGGEVVANIQNKGLKDAFSDISEKPSFWEHYHNTVGPIMEKVDEYYQNRPVEAFMLETGAGLANPTNKVGLGYINKGKTLGAKAVRSGIVGTGIGGVAGGMNTENTEDFIPNTAVGMAIGGALGSALPVAGKVIGGAYNKGKALLAPEASVAGKETGLGNIVKDNDSVRILKRGIMASDDVANQVSDQAPTMMDALNKEMSDIVDNTVGRKLDYERAIENQKERLGKYVKENENLELYSPKTPEQQAQENFNRWFEGSKVVDENGQPLKLYHGTNADFDAFEHGYNRIRPDANGFFFTPRRDMAETYAKGVVDDAKDQYIKEVYLNVKNPYKANNYNEIAKADSKFINQLKKEGYDGIVYKPTEADGVYKPYREEYLAFEPNQVKSVNNSGAWSSSPSLSDTGWTPKSSLKNFTEGLNEFQTESLNKALNEGKKHSTSARGTLGATHKAQEVLNDMIDASYDTKNPFKPRPTTETRDLEIVKQRLNQILEPSGVKELDTSFSKAKALQAAFDKGYSFKPSDIKFSSLGLKTLREKRSFLQGYLRKVQENVLSDGGTNLADAVRKTENVLKEVLPDKKVDKIIGEANRINREFGRLKKLSQMADTTLDKPLAVERPASERWEGIGSWLGSLKDKASAKMWTDSNSRRALALLNGIKENQRRNVMESKLKRLAMLLGLSLNASIARQQNRK